LQHHFPIDDVLLCSGDIRDQVAKLSEIVPEFHKSGSHSNMWQSLVTEIRRQKKKKVRKKDLNDSGETEWPTASQLQLAGEQP